MSGEPRKRHLDNGLCIIGVENRALHSFSCHARVHAGPRFEPRDRAGLTHFLEHMMIQGSERFPTSHDVLRAVEDIGGIIDACTHPESLEVYVGVHRKHCRRGLEVLTDVLLHPLFGPSETEKEKKVVAQEIAEYRDDRHRNISSAELAYSLCFMEEMDELGTRGSVENIQSFDRGLLREEYERFFTPENTVISLAGAFDFDEVCAEFSETLGKARAGRAKPPLVRGELRRRRARAAYRITERVPVVEMDLCYHAYSMSDRRSGEMLALSHVLGGALSSRLFMRVREELGLVYEIWSQPLLYSDTGNINVVLSVDAANLVAAVEATMGVIEQFRREGVTPAELESYKEMVRCGMEIMCDKPGQLADYMGRQELLLPPEEVLTPAQFVARQEALTTTGLHEVIRDICVPASSNLAVVGPFDVGQKDRLTALFPAEEAALPLGM